MTTAKRAKKTPRAIPVVRPPLPPGFIYDDDFLNETGLDNVTAINAVVAELGDGEGESSGYINVYKEKIVGNAKTREFVIRYPAEVHAHGTLLDTLKNDYGGGVYYINIYEKQPDGTTQLVGDAPRKISIFSDPVEKKPVSDVPAVDLAPFQKQMDTINSNFEKLMAAMLNNQTKPKTTAETLEEMRLMREVFAPVSAPAPAAQSGASVADLLSVLKMGVEMGAAGQGTGSDGDWASKAMEMFGKPIVEHMLADKAALAKAPERPALTDKTPTAHPAKPEIAPVQPVEENDMAVLIKLYIRQLSNAAATGQDVGEWADYILTLLPPGQLPEFEAMLRKPDWMETLSAHSPSIREHQVWFTNLRNTTLAFIDEDRMNADGLTVEETGGKVPDHETGDPGAHAQNNNPGESS